MGKRLRRDLGVATSPLPGLTLGRRVRNQVPALWRRRSLKWHDTVMKTVLIVDDHPSFRGFARELLESDGFDVIGESADGESGLQAALSLRPDVVLMDVQLPGVTGFEVTRRLSPRWRQRWFWCRPGMNPITATK